MYEKPAKAGFFAWPLHARLCFVKRRSDGGCYIFSNMNACVAHGGHTAVNAGAGSFSTAFY